MADLAELAGAAVEAARDQEAVEAYAEEARRTEVTAHKGEVEGLTFAESRGVGVRLIAADRLGYAYAADPSIGEVRAAVARARENAELATEDEFNTLPLAMPIEPISSLFRQDQAAIATERKVNVALDLEHLAVSADPRVAKVDQAGYGDAVSRVAIASTAGVTAEYGRTDCWAVVSALAEQDGETQTGWSFRVARELGELDWGSVAQEAVERSARLLGAVKPASGRVPVVLDPFAGSSFLGILAGALSAESVQKQRSLFAGLLGEEVGSPLMTLVDDGRTLDGPAAAPFDDEGVATGRTELIAHGTLTAFLHNAYTARRGGTDSTGNARRGGYRTPPGVGTTNFFVEPGATPVSDILLRAEGGVLIQDVSGVHSGANPISGEFSVGATGLRIVDGELGEPLREMTVASTVPEMLKGIAAVGDDLRFFTAVGVPTILIAEMTVAGV
ncbi:MAG TPA: TldD/PmbA family protein [Actinomycetota bacterium]|nr:TldD/PmbA family protein [Actinomycetota bacterium]